MEQKEVVEKKKFEDLEFVRVTQYLLFTHIPEYLFEQAKDSPFDTDRLNRLSDTLIANPTQLFYVLIDEEKQIKGIFWAKANVFCNCIDVILLSVDKEYQFGDAIKKTLEFIDGNIQKDSTVRIIASRTAAYEKAGFKKTKTMLEIKNTEK